MADTKITALNELVTPDADDVLAIVDDPAGSPETKKIKVSNLSVLDYGQVYTQDGSGSQTLSTGWSKLTQIASNGLSTAAVTPDATNNKITLVNSGIYWVTLAISFSGTGSVTWDIAVYWNGAIVPQLTLERKLGTGGDVDAAGTAGIVDVTSGATDLEVYVNPDGASKDIVVTQLQLSAVRIGAT